MAIERFTNEQFLSAFGIGSVVNGLLPIDERLIEERFTDYQERFQELVRQKTIVAEQSGDNWHDGAFRATDGDANTLAEMVTSLNRALTYPRVGYPEPNEERVTLGSRVHLRNPRSGVGSGYIIDLVGYSSVHDRKEGDVDVASTESPIAKVIVGKRIGEVAVMHRGGMRSQGVEIQIVAIDQDFLRDSDSHDVTE